MKDSDFTVMLPLFTGSNQTEAEPSSTLDTDNSNTLFPNVTMDKPFVTLVIAITSSYSGNGRESRKAIRRTWVNIEHPWKDKTIYKFFMGNPDMTNVTESDLLSDEEMSIGGEE